MKLKRVDLQEPPFSPTALIIDDDIQDDSVGKMVAFVSYSSGGNVVIFFKEGYGPEEVLVAGERFIGETLRATRFKIFDAKVRVEA